MLRRKVVGACLSVAAGLSFLVIPAGSAAAEAGAAADIPCQAWAFYPGKSGGKVSARAEGFCDVIVQSLDLTAYLTRNGTYLGSTRVVKHATYTDWIAAQTVPVSDPAGSQRYCNVVTFKGGDAQGNTFQDTDTSCANL